ncbi:MAG: helix-turn-helix transcriptional regulator [Lachnospiraceae bacterium]|nr:helix-turn-helix transcriptional regulator [Lachnospiraceae bacterium]
MLTKFGKELRKLRIEHDEMLKDMADRIGVTSAYLSAVENGKRKVPASWIGIIGEEYGLSTTMIRKMERLAYNEQDSLKLDMADALGPNREVAYSFARKFKELTPEELSEIRKILGE